MSVTPRLVNNNESAQKSTPNLNLRMKPQIQQPQAAAVRKGGAGISTVGVHNVSPAGKAAYLVQPAVNHGARSTAEIHFAD